MIIFYRKRGGKSSEKSTAGGDQDRTCGTLSARRRLEIRTAVISPSVILGFASDATSLLRGRQDRAFPR